MHPRFLILALGLGVIAAGPATAQDRSYGPPGTLYDYPDSGYGSQYPSSADAQRPPAQTRSQSQDQTAAVPQEPARKPHPGTLRKYGTAGITPEVQFDVDRREQEQARQAQRNRY
ncbi:MAG: hypothetical protein ACM33T_08420 [Solirubrobacterales bacterium]